MSFVKLPAVKGETSCLTCGCGSHDTMSMESVLAVGFGDCTLTKDGEHVYSESEAMHKPDGMIWEGKDAEDAALKEPDKDWRVHFFAPLYEAEYQRQGDKHWVLVRKGQGFA